MDLVQELPSSDEKTELQATIQRLLGAYEKLSNKYHTEKVNNADNSLVLG